MPESCRVFISYSHHDASWLERLRVHLRPLIRSGEIDAWDDTRITPGAEWEQGIADALARANIAVLLVSADFLASDFIHENEFSPLIDAAERNAVTVFWVLLAPCGWKRTPLARIQAVYPTDQPVALMDAARAEAALSVIADRIAGGALSGEPANRPAADSRTADSTLGAPPDAASSPGYTVYAAGATGVAIGASARVEQHFNTPPGMPAPDSAPTTRLARLEAELARQQYALDRIAAKAALYPRGQQPRSLEREIEAALAVIGSLRSEIEQARG